MSNLPLVTCVIPTKSRRMFARKAVEYCARQTYPNIEIVVVDSNPRELFLDNDAVSGLLIRPNRLIRADATCGRARQIGIEQAKGEIVCFFDDDDWHSPLRVAHQVELLTSGYDAIGMKKLLTYDLRQKKGFPHQSWVNPCWTGAGMTAVRREIGLQVPWRDTNYNEDGLWYEDLEKGGFKISTDVPIDHYIYIRHSGNYSCEQRVIDEDATELIRGYIGDDMAWYDDLSEIIGTQAPISYRGPGSQLMQVRGRVLPGIATGKRY